FADDLHVNSKGKKFSKSRESDILFIKTGSKKLTSSDQKNIMMTISKAVDHVNKGNDIIKMLRLVITEICGNAIEWGGTEKKQWLLGVRYNEDSVIFTFADVGVGILKSLNRKFKDKLADAITRSSVEVLKRAFEKKYDSKSGDVNRNQGLPSIKKAYDDGFLPMLKTLTNKVFLDFSDNFSKSQSLNNEFKGTVYQWELKK
ncbi:hypothetical protein ACQ1R0_05770, partial [Ornithobacterium rhinotracheale]